MITSTTEGYFTLESLDGKFTEFEYDGVPIILDDGSTSVCLSVRELKMLRDAIDAHILKLEAE